MNEIVERLAQAICADEKQEWKQLEISQHGRGYLDGLRARARRYIGGIEPNGEMVNAGFRVLSEPYYQPLISGPPGGTHTAPDEIFRAMIKVAVK